jgi:hypothetical protein
MKTGDLVTLSSYGIRLSHARDFYSSWSRNKMLGIITGIAPSQYNYDGRPLIKVRWMTRGPEGRSYYEKYFHRSDLKFVSKA